MSDILRRHCPLTSVVYYPIFPHLGNFFRLYSPDDVDTAASFIEVGSSEAQLITDAFGDSPNAQPTDDHIVAAQFKIVGHVDEDTVDKMNTAGLGVHLNDNLKDGAKVGKMNGGVLRTGRR